MKGTRRTLFRQVACFFAISGVLAGLSIAALVWVRVSYAHAQVGSTILDLGASLAKRVRAGQDSTRRLELNGMEIHFRTRTVKLPPGALLGEHEASCASGAEGEATLRRSGGRAGLLRSLAALATLSHTRHGRGFVACIEVGRDESGLAEVTHRFVQFARTSDLSELGRARFVYVGAVEEGSFELSAWTQGSFILRNMIPRAHRDSPGGDLLGVARPRHTRRILTAREAGAPTAVAVYLAPALLPRRLLDLYRPQLAATGWEFLEHHDDEWVQFDGATLAAAQRGADTVAVAVYPKGALGSFVVVMKASES